MTLCVCGGGMGRGGEGRGGKMIGGKGGRKRRTGGREEGRKKVTAGAQTTLPDMQSR